jgi:hypothetical protein
MRARVEGQWFGPFDPAEVNNNYTEANAWQYSFFVPQDIDGLIGAIGGDVAGAGAFARKLDDLFSANTQTTGRNQADITGLIGQYAHGNEPSHHIAYLYDFAGQAWKTQAMVRRIMDTMYRHDPDGEIGNDDCGQMSAWLVLSELGIYDVTPGANQYAVGSPLFPVATIHFENGKAFVIRANGASAKNVYIRSAKLNGADRWRSFLEYSALANGGEFVLEMSDTPNMSFGSTDLYRPHTSIPGPAIVPVPYVESGSTVFRDKTEVAFSVNQQLRMLRYSLDGTPVTTSSPRYLGPLTLTDTTTVNVIALESPTGPASLPLTVTFHKIPDGRRITLSAKYANQYNAGGNDALIDTLRGGTDFRNGRWQGYLGTDLTAIVDLGSVQDVRQVSMGFLQDAGSWILMPKRVRFEVSEDGTTYSSIGIATHDIPDRESGTITRDLSVTAASPLRARYVRVTVERYGRLPDWHPGKGEESWFFADEIVIVR